MPFPGICAKIIVVELCIYKYSYLRPRPCAREKRRYIHGEEAQDLYPALEEGQVLPAQLQLESLPGNSTNPDSYPFEVMMLRVKGANMDTIEANPCQAMLDKFIAVCKDLAEQGVKAITTSCGFTAYYQEGLAAAVPELVFTSALLQVPFVQTMVGPNRKVAVLTANKNHLREEHLQRAKITDRDHLVILSLHDQPEWGRIYTHPNEEFDLEAVTDEVVGVVRKGLELCFKSMGVRPR